MSTYDSGKTPTLFTSMSPVVSEGRIIGTYMLAAISLLAFFSLLIVPLGNPSDFMFLVGFTTMIFAVVSAYKISSAEKEARTNLRTNIRTAAEDYVKGDRRNLSEYILHPSGDDDNGAYVNALSARQLKWIEKNYHDDLNRSKELHRRKIKNVPALNSIAVNADNGGEERYESEESATDNALVESSAVEREEAHFEGDHETSDRPRSYTEVTDSQDTVAFDQDRKV